MGIPSKCAMGRPKGSGSKYTIAISERICDEVSSGKPLRHVCREMGLPWRTIYDWVDAHPDFATRLARARILGEDAIAEECIEIANTPLEGIETTEESTTAKTDSDGDDVMLPGTITKTKRSDMLGHRKLQIETRLKLLAIWNPKKFGPKVENTHLGDPKAPVALVLQGSDVHG